MSKLSLKEFSQNFTETIIQCKKAFSHVAKIFDKLSIQLWRIRGIKDEKYDRFMKGESAA